MGCLFICYVYELGELWRQDQGLPKYSTLDESVFLTRACLIYKHNGLAYSRKYSHGPLLHYSPLIEQKSKGVLLDFILRDVSHNGTMTLCIMALSMLTFRTED